MPDCRCVLLEAAISSAMCSGAQPPIIDLPSPRSILCSLHAASSALAGDGPASKSAAPSASPVVANRLERSISDGFVILSLGQSVVGRQASSPDAAVPTISDPQRQVLTIEHSAALVRRRLRRPKPRAQARGWNVEPAHAGAGERTDLGIAQDG